MLETNGQGERNAMTVRVDGEEAVLHITDQSVMFEKGGKVSGFERNSIRLVKPDGDAMVIAYALGSEVRSVRVEPMNAVISLLAPGPGSDSKVQAPVAGLVDAFDRLYRDTRKDLEDRLDTINKEPGNIGLRLTQDEFDKYTQVRNQMWDILATKYHFDQYAPGNSFGFFGLENEPHDRQLDTVKSLQVDFLIYLARANAEGNDVHYETDDVWPEEWDVVLTRFELTNGMPLPTERWNNYMAYLRTKWTRYPKGNKTPILARP